MKKIISIARVIMNLIVVIAGVYSGMSWLELYGITNSGVNGPSTWVYTIVVSTVISLIGLMISANDVLDLLLKYMKD